jgi:hypothetical protein
VFRLCLFFFGHNYQNVNLGCLHPVPCTRSGLGLPSNATCSNGSVFLQLIIGLLGKFGLSNFICDMQA